MLYDSHDDLTNKITALISELESIQEEKNKEDEYKCACDNLKTAVSFLNHRKAKEGE